MASKWEVKLASGWTTLPHDLSLLLNRAQRPVIYHVKGVAYQYDIQTKTQKNLSTQFIRHLRRVAGDGDGDGKGIPRQGYGGSSSSANIVAAAGIAISKVQVCKRSGCATSCFVDPSGRVHDFCSKRCANSKPATQTATQTAFQRAPNTVYFYDVGEPFYEFTNFAAYQIHVDGLDWPTSEHYFQAQKFVDDPQLQLDISRLATPRQAFDFSRQHSNAVRLDWAAVKDDVMLVAVRAKFAQHASLCKLLLDTDHQTLVEHTSNDSYW